MSDFVGLKNIRLNPSFIDWGKNIIYPETIKGNLKIALSFDLRALAIREPFWKELRKNIGLMPRNNCTVFI
jgi:hypothetical protein